MCARARRSRRAVARTGTARTRRRAARCRTPQTSRGTGPPRPTRRPTPAATRAGGCATPMARLVQRPLVVQVQPLERLARRGVRAASPPYAPPRPPRPIPAQVHRRPMLARRAVEGAHAAQHARLGREGVHPRLLVLRVRVRHKVVPQPRSQMWPHLPREARGGRGDERAPPLLGAPPREALQRGACAAAPAGRRGGGGRGGRRESWRGERRGGR